MVLVTVGTQKQQFNRFFELIKKSKELKKEEIIAQIGYTKFESKRIHTFDFIPLDEMDKYIDEADLVITHGGVGTIFSALKKNKKVIAIPRLEKYGEHINDHQIQNPAYEMLKLKEVLILGLFLSNNLILLIYFSMFLQSTIF